MMPLYTYYCVTCDREFDLLRSHRDSGKTAVCECGKEVKRVIRMDSNTIRIAGKPIETLSSFTGYGV